MIYAYIRVSTDKQTVENQRFEIENYCRKRQIDVDQYIEETISGMKDVDKRKLGILLKKMKKDDTLIASEISRLGRRLLEVMSILDNLMKKKIRVITVKEGFELCDNLQSHVIAFAFSLASEIERSLISQRTKEALARKKSLGVNYPQAKDLWALDVERSSCIGHDSNSHLSWVFTYPHVAMLRAALTSASATLPQCAQRKCLPFLMPM